MLIWLANDISLPMKLPRYLKHSTFSISLLATFEFVGADGHLFHEISIYLHLHELRVKWLEFTQSSTIETSFCNLW